jgi:hypothetical protein
VLGAAAAEAYLRAVLRICCEGLRAGSSVSLFQDKVRAEPTQYLRSSRQEIHELALRLADLGVEIAEAPAMGLSTRLRRALRALWRRPHARRVPSTGRTRLSRRPGALLHARRIWARS